jgi:hypothetical protein
VGRSVAAVDLAAGAIVKIKIADCRMKIAKCRMKITEKRAKNLLSAIFTLQYEFSNH